MSEDDLREALPCLRTHVAIQSGVGTRAPVYIAADADYESGDGNCGLHEDEKYANEPAILYVRADLLMDMRAENAALREEVGRLRGLAAEARAAFLLLRRDHANPSDEVTLAAGFMVSRINAALAEWHEGTPE